MKKAILLGWLIIGMMACNKDTEPAGPDSSLRFRIGSEAFEATSMVSVYNQSRLVISGENETGDRLEIKLSNIDFLNTGYLPLSFFNYVSYYDALQNRGYLSYQIPQTDEDSILISVIRLDEQRVAGQFDLSLFGISNINLSEGVFSAQYVVSTIETAINTQINNDAFSASVSQISSNTNTNKITIYTLDNTTNSSILISMPRGVTPAEYTIQPGPPILNSNEVQGWFRKNSVDIPTFTGQLTIDRHDPSLREIEGHYQMTTAEDTINTEFKGFYF